MAKDLLVVFTYRDNISKKTLKKEKFLYYFCINIRISRMPWHGTFHACVFVVLLCQSIEMSEIERDPDES